MGAQIRARIATWVISRTPVGACKYHDTAWKIRLAGIVPCRIAQSRKADLIGPSARYGIEPLANPNL